MMPGALVLALVRFGMIEATTAATAAVAKIH
jgi:hypothetical protein